MITIPFFKNNECQLTFNNIVSDVNFVNNDMLNNLIINFDNLCKTHL